MKHNFGAGPCILPQEVFKQAADAVLDFNGLSILEVSHRHKDFVAVMDEAIDLVKKAGEKLRTTSSVDTTGDEDQIVHLHHH